jgi:hypothetical protein
MEDRTGAKKDYKPITVKYSLVDGYKETYRPPTS